ncbi:hypothetical protein VPH35_119919 [Triticum aestivum]
MATFGEQQNEQGHAAVAAKRRMAQPTKKARKPEFLGEPVPADEACANWPQRYQWRRSAGLSLSSLASFLELVAQLAGVLSTASATNSDGEFQTQFRCRTDRSGLVGDAPWITVPYPFQWEAPTFHAAECFAMMAAAFVALVELNKCKMHDEIFCRVLLRTAISRKDGKLKQIAKDGEVERLKVESPYPQRHQRFVVDLIRDRPRGRPWRSGCWLARAFGADADDDDAG